MASFASLLAGCLGGTLDWQTRQAPDGFVPGSRVLAEVTALAPRDAVLSREGPFEHWSEDLAALGYATGEVADGSEIVAWVYCYAHNSSVPVCAHHGHYLAHVPESLRDGMRAEDETSGQSGDLIEIELTATPSGRLAGEVMAVYRHSGRWNDCRTAVWQDTSAVFALSPLGPPRAMWIECDDAESDGWIRTPVRGAPPAGPRPVSTWVKAPRQRQDPQR